MASFGEAAGGQGDRKPTKPREMWIVLGPLDPDNLPVGCGAARLPPELILRVLKVVELIFKIDRPAKDQGE